MALEITPRMMRTAITAELFLGHIEIAYATYNRNGAAVHDVVPELMILAAIAAHTVRQKGAPISVNALARKTHIPRSTVQHRLDNLEQQGAVVAVMPYGYIFNFDGYLIPKVDPSIQQRTAALVAATYIQLQKNRD